MIGRSGRYVLRPSQGQCLPGVFRGKWAHSRSEALLEFDRVKLNCGILEFSRHGSHDIAFRLRVSDRSATRNGAFKSLISPFLDQVAMMTRRESSRP